jgi:prepilin-type N-terminal cleavage/methylation domain-containing protein
MKTKTGNSGFTLVELLVVIAVTARIKTSALTSFGGCAILWRQATND